MVINRYENSNENKYIICIKNFLKKIIPGFMIKRRRDLLIKNQLRKKEKLYSEQFAAKFHDCEKVPIFETIQIETINRCNGECPFCPVNRHVDTRKTIKMSDELFDKIIGELSSMDYRGAISLYSNNEPLLDTKLESRAQIAKTKCPNAYIYIFTNGTLMTEERLLKMEPWFDKIVIDNYNDELKVNDNLKPIIKMCENDLLLDKKIEIHLRKINEVLFTRGGQSPNNNNREIRTYPCNFPFNQLVIRPDGKVSLCCCDALGKMTLGDVSSDTLLDVWYSEEYRIIREKVIRDISTIDLCKYCDTIHK